MRALFLLILFPVISSTSFGYETTPVGYITGIEARWWGLHVNTTFAAGASLGCPQNVGNWIMYDYVVDPNNKEAGWATVNAIYAAYFSQTKISFRSWGCHWGDRPQIGDLIFHKID